MFATKKKIMKKMEDHINQLADDWAERGEKLTQLVKDQLKYNEENGVDEYGKTLDYFIEMVELAEKGEKSKVYEEHLFYKMQLENLQENHKGLFELVKEVRKRKDNEKKTI